MVVQYSSLVIIDIFQRVAYFNSPWTSKHFSFNSSMILYIYIYWYHEYISICYTITGSLHAHNCWIILSFIKNSPSPSSLLSVSCTKGNQKSIICHQRDYCIHTHANLYIFCGYGQWTERETADTYFRLLYVLLNHVIYRCVVIGCLDYASDSWTNKSYYKVASMCNSNTDMINRN